MMIDDVRGEGDKNAENLMTSRVNDPLIRSETFNKFSETNLFEFKKWAVYHHEVTNSKLQHSRTKKCK